MSAALDQFSSNSSDARRHGPGGIVHARVAAGDAGRVQPGIAGRHRAAPGVGRHHVDLRRPGREQPLADAGAITR
ncbi:hypothetical protein D3C72_2211470 [compost metagenome]